ncbi:integral membrane protein-like protein [Halenospora varia]|nr:integral membrane protein-like protein [Halenospora varia]
MKVLQALGVAVATLAPLATSLVTFTGGSGISYSIGVPPGSTISQSVTGGLYFSITAPTSYQWVGFGIGSQMANAQIFVMYANAAGNNVTLSGRNGGRGRVPPTTDSTLQSGLTLLTGSGIVGGNMVAYVHCTTCKLASAATSTSSPFIAAWMAGSSLSSNSVSQAINQHGDSDYKQVTGDLTKAAMSTDSNPFVASTTSGSGSSSTGTTSSPSSTSTSGSHGGDSSESESGSSGSSGASESKHVSAATIHKYDAAHGIVMGIAACILFPSGAILVRLVGMPWLHAAIQLLSFAGMIAGLGLGVKLAQYRELLFNNSHTIFGVVIVALLLLQPFIGLAHHHLYKKHSSRTGVSHAHIWYGRILMLLAVINGGLGIKLAANTTSGRTAWIVVSAIMGTLYIGAILFKRKSNVGVSRFGSKEKIVRNGQVDSTEAM